MKNLSLLVLSLFFAVNVFGQLQVKNDRKQLNNKVRKLNKTNLDNNCENPKDYVFIDFNKISKGFEKEIIKINIKTIGQAPPFNPTSTEITFAGKFIETNNYNGFAYMLFKENKIGGIIVKKDFGKKLLDEDFIIEMSPMSNCVTKNGGTWVAFTSCTFDAIFYTKEFERDYRDQ